MQTNHEPSDANPGFKIYATVGTVENGVLRLIDTDRRHLAVEVYGEDVNVVGKDGEFRFYQADKIFFHDMENLYSTNGENGKPIDFVIIDPATKKVVYSFHINAQVLQNKNGNIIVVAGKGIGFLRNPYGGNRSGYSSRE